MPVTEKEALEVFGVADLAQFETVDAFKEAIEKDWLKASTAHTNAGVKAKVVGTFNRTAAKKIEELNTLYDLGLEIDANTNLYDIVPKISDALKPKFDGFKELQEKVKTSAPADVVAKFEHDLKEAQKKAEANAKEAKRWEAQFTELDGTVKTREKTSKVEGEWSRGFGAVPFSPQVDTLRKEGFNSVVRKEVEILFDDEGKPYAAYAEGPKKGEPLMHPKKAAERWPLPDYLKAKAEELKLVGANPQGGKPVSQPVVRQPETPTPGRFAARERKQPDRIM